MLESADPGAIVLVNGNRTQQCELRDQDTIVAGHLTAVFHAYEPMAVPAAAVETQAPLAVAAAPALQFGTQSNPSGGKKKSKEKTGSTQGKGKMRGALIGLAFLGLVAGGGLAAQKTGVLDYALNSSPDDHFEFLSESVPGDFPVFVSGSLRRLISAYPEIAQSTSELPPLDVISKQMMQQIGIPLNAIERITLGMDPTTSTYVGALSLVDDASLRSLKSHIKEKMPEGTSKVKFGNKITILVDAPTGQKIAIYAPRGRHILFADEQTMERFVAGEITEENRIISDLRGNNTTFAAGYLASAMKDLPPSPEFPELSDLTSALVTLDYASDLSSLVTLNFKSPATLDAMKQRCGGDIKAHYLAQAEASYTRKTGFPMSDDIRAIMEKVSFRPQGSLLAIAATFGIEEFEKAAKASTGADIDENFVGESPQP